MVVWWLNGTYCIFKQFLIIVGLIVRLLTYAGYRNRYDQEKASSTKLKAYTLIMKLIMRV